MKTNKPKNMPQLTLVLTCKTYPIHSSSLEIELLTKLHEPPTLPAIITFNIGAPTRKSTFAKMGCNQPIAITLTTGRILLFMGWVRFWIGDELEIVVSNFNEHSGEETPPKWY